MKRGYIELSTKLLDAMPSKKHDVTVHPPRSYAEIEQQRASSVEEVRNMASKEDWDV